MTSLTGKRAKLKAHLDAEASGLAILAALTLFLGTLMVGLPVLHRWLT